ncbi:MAG: hypothetical protein ACLU9S_12880 [Oscillospiraceae bacterium]
MTRPENAGGRPRKDATPSSPPAAPGQAAHRGHAAGQAGEGDPPAPSLGPAMPNKAGEKTLIIDCGANVECTPEFLLQFGVVGSLYAQKAMGMDCPRVGLLNNGTEDSKGPALQKEAYAFWPRQARQAS